MDSYAYRIEEIPLNHEPSRQKAESFLASHGLRLDPSLERYYGAFRGDRLVAGAGYAGSVVKGAAVADEFRGEGLTNALVSRIASELHRTGVHNLFVFTKPENEILFAGLGFSTVERTSRVVLLESDSRAFPDYLETLAVHRGEGGHGAIVMNCNPFTLGHRRLVEYAAARCHRLLLFVVEEDVSAFPFAVRLRLVREGTADLRNVTVVAGGPYIISAATFPTYFINDASGLARAQTELDVAVFGRRIAPAAGIAVRFAGAEPFSPVTRLYNEAMRSCLPPLGVKVEIIPRLAAAGEAISASRVRALLAAGRLAETRDLVPETTCRYLASPEAEPVLDALRAALRGSGSP